jgi:hypothetical protein
VIEGDVRPPAELNHPFAELGGQLFHGTAHLRMLAQQLHSLPERLRRPFGRVPALRGKKIV